MSEQLCSVSQQRTSVGEDAEKGEPSAPLVGMQIGEATVEKCWGFLKKLKMELSYDPVIPLLGIYPKKLKTLIRKNTCTHMFVIVLLTIAKTWKQTKCLSVDEWTKSCDTCTPWNTIQI